MTMGLTLNSVPMQMTPQEEYLYQMHLRNAMGPGGVTNFNGSRSTLRQMDTDINGRTYNLPTVWGGRILSPNDAVAKAHAVGLSNFPSYSDPMVAEDRYRQMHGLMDEDIQRLSRLPIPMGAWGQ